MSKSKIVIDFDGDSTTIIPNSLEAKAKTFRYSNFFSTTTYTILLFFGINFKKRYNRSISLVKLDLSKEEGIGR
jgi:hypothetical protein